MKCPLGSKFIRPSKIFCAFDQNARKERQLIPIAICQQPSRVPDDQHERAGWQPLEVLRAVDKRIPIATKIVRELEARREFIKDAVSIQHLCAAQDVRAYTPIAAETTRELIQRIVGGDNAEEPRRRSCQ
jgi:hypothetical protein